MLYLTLGAVFSLNYLFSISNLSRQRTRLIAFSFFVLSISCISGIRWATGTDWASYLSFYDSGGSFRDYMSYSHFEPGFKFSVWLFHFAGVAYSLWLFLLTFFVLSIKFLPIYRRAYVLICFLVIFGASMADLFPTRQALAISLVILSGHYLIRRAYWLYAGCVVLATLFHATAVVFIFAPVILYLSYRALFLFTLCSGLLLKLFMFDLVNFIATYLHLGDMLIQVELYSATIQGRISLLSITQKVIIMLFSFQALSKCKHLLTQYEHASVKFMVFGLGSSIFLESASTIFNRLTIYFVSFEFVAVSSLVYFYTKYLLARGMRLGALGFFVSTCIFYFVRFWGLFLSYPDLYYPFETVFQSSHKFVY
jgi:transmembrane protein EpsG